MTNKLTEEIQKANEWWAYKRLFEREVKNKITQIIPYYKNLPMMKVHLENWDNYPSEVLEHLHIIFIDDFSPLDHQPDALLKSSKIRSNISLFRNLEDKGWNPDDCRNLGAMQSSTEWWLMHDMDHLMLWQDMWQLMTMDLDQGKTYRPSIIRMNPRMPWVDRIKTNQFLVSKTNFWKAGGYDADYAGMRIADTCFIHNVQKHAPIHVMDGVRFLRYDNSFFPGSETYNADRSRKEASRRGKELRAKKGMDAVPVNPVRFKWIKVL